MSTVKGPVPCGISSTELASQNIAQRSRNGANPCTETTEFAWALGLDRRGDWAMPPPVQPLPYWAQRNHRSPTPPRPCTTDLRNIVTGMESSPVKKTEWKIPVTDQVRLEHLYVLSAYPLFGARSPIIQSAILSMSANISTLTVGSHSPVITRRVQTLRT